MANLDVKGAIFMLATFLFGGKPVAMLAINYGNVGIILNYGNVAMLALCWHYVASYYVGNKL